jgi:hypothetical protein
MPAQQPVEFKSPLKGVIKNAAYADLNPEFAADALNVVPQDKNGRYRVNQRTGTKKVLTLATASVTALMQTTTPLDPSTLPLTVTQVNDSFPEANGTTLKSTGRYTTSDLSTNPNTVLSTAFNATANITIQSNKVTYALANMAAAQYAQALTLGKVYSVKATFVSATPNASKGFYVFFRRDDANGGGSLRASLLTSAGPLMQFAIEKNDGSGGVASTATVASTLSAGTPFTLEIRVAGNVLTIYLDGVSKLSTTSSIGSAYTGVGFMFPAGDNVTNFTVQTADPRAVYRQNNLVAVANGNIYEGDLSSCPPVTGGSGVLDGTVLPGVAYSQGFAYFVDGTSIVKVNLATKATVAYAATAGTAPVGCTLATVYRDRLILAAPLATPQNFYCSRVGTHTDWDYSQTDPAAAFAGNASTAGHIGEPIAALMPFTDDVMLIGGDHNLWAVRGDPADQGSIDLISDAIGMMGPNAWTKAPDGTVYFLGTGGLFKMSPFGGLPTNVSSSKWNEFFRTIDRTRNYCSLAWDRNNHNLYIFITPALTGTATHLLYDEQTQGFWPLQFPNNQGPISAIVWDGDLPGDRVILMGGRTGLIQKLDATATDDDGTAINSFIYVGPYAVSDVTEATLQWMDVILAEPVSPFLSTDFNAVVSLQAGQTVEKAVNSPLRTASRTYTSARRQTRWLGRLRGNVFFLKIANSVIGKTWGLEKAIGMFMGGGLVRRK